MSVVAIKQMSRESQEFNSFASALSFQGWTFKIQSIIQSTGLPANVDFTQADTVLPSGSMASRFGHKTLGGYISSNNVNMGHGYEWSQWCKEVEAYQHKTKFGIYDNNVEEILKQVSDIEKALGRLPVDSAEFHKAKDEILLKQKRDAEVRHQSEVRMLSGEIENLKGLLSDSQNEIADIESKLGEAIPQTVVDSYLEQLQEKESLIIALRTKINILESNANVSLDIEINQLIDNYHTVLDYLNKFKEKNSKLKGEITHLKTEVKFLKSELKSKNTLIKTLTHKNSQLISINLLTTSLFIGGMSIMFLMLALALK